MTESASDGAGDIERIGFTCSYTPLPLIRAAGYTPYRLLPLGDAPDRAGSLLHDNMCPHVKRIIDRAMDGGLPRLAGLVVMNSCDTMRRLADGWSALWPEDRVAIVELPTAPGKLANDYLVEDLGRVRDLLSDWAGRPIEDTAIDDAIRSYDELARALKTLEARWRTGDGSRSALQ